MNRQLDKARILGYAEAPLPKLPLTGLVEVEIKITYKNKVVNNVFWYKGDSAPDGTALTTLASDFQTAFVTNILPLMSFDFFLISTTATDWSVDDGNFQQVFPTPGTKGGVSEHVNNVVDALAIIRTSAFSGRGGIGHTRLAGVVDSDVVDSVLTSTAITNWSTALAAWFTAARTLGPFTWVNVSFFLDKASRNPPVVYPVTDLAFDFAIHHQTSRAIYRA